MALPSNLPAAWIVALKLMSAKQFLIFLIYRGGVLSQKIG
jgi:hypothetical protein